MTKQSTSAITERFFIILCTTRQTQRPSCNWYAAPRHDHSRFPYRRYCNRHAVMGRHSRQLRQRDVTSAASQGVQLQQARGGRRQAHFFDGDHRYSERRPPNEGSTQKKKKYTSLPSAPHSRIQRQAVHTPFDAPIQRQRRLAQAPFAPDQRAACFLFTLAVFSVPRLTLPALCRRYLNQTSKPTTKQAHRAGRRLQNNSNPFSEQFIPGDPR